MKKLIRPSALFALLALGLTCVSCSFNVDTSGAIAVYEGRTYPQWWFIPMSVLFYPDGEYKTFMRGKDDTMGTYVVDGDFNNGTVLLSETHEYKDGKWTANSDTVKGTFANGALITKYGTFMRTK